MPGLSVAPLAPCIISAYLLKESETVLDELAPSVAVVAVTAVTADGGLDVVGDAGTALTLAGVTGASPTAPGTMLLAPRTPGRALSTTAMLLSMTAAPLALTAATRLWMAAGSALGRTARRRLGFLLQRKPRRMASYTDQPAYLKRDTDTTPVRPARRLLALCKLKCVVVYLLGASRYTTGHSVNLQHTT